MKFIPIKTRVMQPPRDDFFDLLAPHLSKIKDGDILFVTSKVLGIHQGRCVRIGPNVDKDALIKKEADRFLPRQTIHGLSFIFTIKDSTLIPSAGIDESNANGYYVLWPKRADKLAKQICEFVKKKNKLNKFAVIVTDSHTIPLRYGVIGISTGFFGLEPFFDYKGQPDIFGRKLKFTKTNIVDGLSSMAVLLMGEGKEQTPLVIARGLLGVNFTNHETYKKLVIPPEQDIYRPILKIFPKKKPLKR
jgi:dihydrofolate synthase / folylpolyglutamate synthase